MYNAITIEVDNKNKLFPYFEDMCKKSKNLKNVSNFYIRQLMTGLKKENSNKQENEKEVINIIEKGILKANSKKQENLIKRLEKLESSAFSLEEKIKKEKEYRKKATPFSMPTSKHWFIGYDILESVLRESENIDYLSLPSQVNQQCIKEVIENWNSYFKALKDYKINPQKYKGKPKIPKYKKKEMSNTVFTNITCKLKNINGITYLRFPKIKEFLNLGTYLSKKDSLATVEVIPYYGKFKVIITLGNAPKKITLKEKKEQEELKYKNAKRIFSIDLGVNNFVTISNNIETVPIVIKGKFIKSFNQYFNSKRAFLISELTKGNNDNYYTQTKALNNLSRKRENFFKDTFYKISHFILNECKIYNIDTVVIGKNDGWKQNINTGKVNNQNFVSIPFNKFITILTYILEKNDINVIEKEESYTSKASFLDNDDIPTYKEGDTTKYIFSGKRIERGLYKSKNNILINADINGASNILKKAIPNAFNNISNFSYLYKTIKVINFNDIYKQGEIKPNAKKTLSIKTINKRVERRYNLIYYKKRNKRYKELKQVFQVILDRCGNEPLVK